MPILGIIKPTQPRQSSLYRGYSETPVSDEYTDAGATASDDTDGDLTDKITVTGDDFDTNIGDLHGQV